MWKGQLEEFPELKADFLPRSLQSSRLSDLCRHLIPSHWTAPAVIPVTENIGCYYMYFWWFLFRHRRKPACNFSVQNRQLFLSTLLIYCLNGVTQKMMRSSFLLHLMDVLKNDDLPVFVLCLDNRYLVSLSNKWKFVLIWSSLLRVILRSFNYAIVISDYHCFWLAFSFSNKTYTGEQCLWLGKMSRIFVGLCLCSHTKVNVQETRKNNYTRLFHIITMTDTNG